MQELYKETFSHLHASGGAIREAKTMKTGHIRKGLAIGVAAAALMATAAGAANAATDGRLFEEARIFFLGDWTYQEDGSKTVNGVDENGNEVHFSVVPGTGDEQGADEGVIYTTTTKDENGVLVTDSGARVQVDEETPVTHEDGSTSSKSTVVTVTEN